MLWLWIVLVAQFAQAGALFLDKLLLTKSFPRPAVLTFWTAIANLLGVVFVFGDFQFFPGWKILILSLISGITFTIALQFLYMGLKKGEATHITPLVGAVVPVASFILSYFWLHEVLSLNQTVAVVFLVLGALVISSETTKKRTGWHIGMLWAIFAGLFFAVSYVLARGVFIETSFSTGFVWARVGSALAALPILLMPGIWQDLFAKKKKKEKTSAFGILAINKGLAALYFVGMNYAISLTSATIVNALAGLQYALLFLLILIVTKYWPKTLKEYFTKKEIIQEIFAILLIIVGLGFLVI